MPMILDEQGAKLSKRTGAADVMQYKDAGYLPDALLSYLARLGWSHGDQELFSRQELIDLGERVERAAAHQAVIGVVFHNFDAHPAQKPVVSDRRRPLEDRICFAGRTHAINDVAACLVLRDEPVDRVHVVLQIGVE